KENVDEKVTLSSSEIKNDDGKSLDILVKIPIASIVPNPYQPRTTFNKTSLDELKKSILENGLIQPITVRRKNNEYQLISGERRLRASKEIGIKEIPAYIIKVDTKEAMVALSLIENIQREELNPIEVATAYKQLMDECSLSQEEIADKVGKERSTITNTMRLLKLPLEIQEYLIHGKISSGHARALLSVTDESYQMVLLKKILRDQLSVRAVEKLSQSSKIKPTPKNKKFDIDPNSIDEIAKRDMENKLRGIFGTKVLFKQKKDGTGNITIDFYSVDELERLLELFDTIGKNHS
ncbi:MAG: ParB/RepB/Spo0J family partition protein, partial [Melioribacteraceae bacterium]|nr:ParB/RepB/Spo0J family partition protein [Melioribacteraceae bacterium]